MMGENGRWFGTHDVLQEGEHAYRSGPVDIADAHVEMASQPLAYTGAELEPEVKLLYGEYWPKLGEDYEIAYSNNVNAGVASVVVKGIGRYTGSKMVEFHISKAILELPQPKDGLAYKGKRITGVAARAGYSVKGGSAVNAGSYKAVLAADDNHVFKTGGSTAIVRWSIAKAKSPVSAKARSVKPLKAKSLAKGRVVLKRPVAVKKAIGSVTCKNASKTAKLKRFKVNAKTGAVTVPKSTKAGAYKLKLRVIDSGSRNYKKTVKTVTVKLVVK